MNTLKNKFRLIEGKFSKNVGLNILLKQYVNTRNHTPLQVSIFILV